MSIHLMIFYLLVIMCFVACGKQEEKIKTNEVTFEADTFLAVLGIAQDAGYPQIACTKKCCKNIWGKAAKKKLVSCIGIVDVVNGKKWIIDATPDFKEQTFNLKEIGDFESAVPDGVLLTHAHIGHYTGLMHLGKEALGGSDIPVFAMPQMTDFLSNNGPWDQLVKSKNIKLIPLRSDSIIRLSNLISVKPITVPHRDEYSETVGFVIYGKSKSALFIPDIDKWQKWNRNIKDEIATVDYAFLDGTFYSNGEIPGRDMSLIPHPFIEESISLFKDLSQSEKQKIHFIHLNHTNPLLDKESSETQEFERTEFKLAFENQLVQL